MIVVDTNYVVRLLVEPQSAADKAMSARATALFAVESESYTTSEAVVTEIAYVLQGVYRFPRDEIANRLRSFLLDPRCRLSTRQRCVAAVNLWETRAGLSLVDALVAVRAQEAGAKLATFDRKLARDAGVPMWEP